ncbi:hypothetical protein BBP40_007242 [Aspergillus hancockii]|nr:hypothetical protein BBP40_007242 [Aspergillus hancockii]
MYPHLAASGSHYARTVTPQHPKPAVLPDPSLIFDTCGLYVNIILNDYLRTILNLNENPTESDWTLDPRKSLEVFDKGGVPRGVGNQVSAEFNMLYRWHTAISNQDEAWANSLCRRTFGPEVDGSTLSVNQFLDGLRKYFEDNEPGEPATWTFGGLEWQQDGRFVGGELVRIMSEGCENVAGAFGARNIPKVMKAIEMLGIEQGRQWQLATLNEFREFFKLKPYSTFLEVNPNPAIAEALEALYDHPDNLELYVGVQAEEAKKPFYPGSGLCPGFTKSAAILSDAVALVRGDRFYTVDYGPANLTNFGFNAASSEFNAAGGGVMYKLLMRAFPGWYQPNSVYALYPFVTPEKSREIMDKYMKFKDLNFDRPSYTPPPVPVTTWEEATKVLEDQKRCHVPWQAKTVGYVSWACGGGYGFYVGTYGFGVDQILGAKVAVASGEIIDTDDDPELLWAIRGAGAGFLGVVVELRVKVYPSPKLYAGYHAFPPSDAANVFSRFETLLSDGFPDEFSGVTIVADPELLPVPVTAKKFLHKMTQLGTVLVNTVTETTAAAYGMGDSASATFFRSRNVKGLQPDIVHNNHGKGMRNEISDGIGSVFANRYQHIILGLHGGIRPGPVADAQAVTVATAWAKELEHAINEEGLSLEGGFPSFFPPEQVTISQFFGEQALGRLKQLKKRLDPENVFCKVLPCLC